MTNSIKLFGVYQHKRTAGTYTVVDNEIKIRNTNGVWEPGVLYTNLQGERFARTVADFIVSFNYMHILKREE